MVIFGGLEILAAGYVLNEINKDDKKTKERHHRKKHEHRHSPSRPSRPQMQQQQLRPPQHGPGRPSSAPPPKTRPHFQGHPPMPTMQGRPPPQTQSWPVQARPPTPAEAAQYHTQTHSRPPQSTYPGTPPAPGPGYMQQAPTMHFDTKTGKWQSNMLPPDMQPGGQGGNGNRSLSNVGLPAEGDGQRRMSTAQIQPAPHPLAREESYSSVSSTSSTSSDGDLAYGKMYEKNRQPRRRVLSHDRGRPHELANTGRPMAAAPVELDWYATQAQAQQKPAMAHVAQALLNREGRAATLPTQTQQYSASQPNLPVYEMDGTGASPNMRTASPRPQQHATTMELDSRETERYRAFRRAEERREGEYQAYRPG